MPNNNVNEKQQIQNHTLCGKISFKVYGTTVSALNTARSLLSTDLLWGPTDFQQKLKKQTQPTTNLNPTPFEILWLDSRDGAANAR